MGEINKSPEQNNEVLSGFAGDIRKPSVGKPTVKYITGFNREIPVEEITGHPWGVVHKTQEAIAIFNNIIQKYTMSGPQIYGHGERGTSENFNQSDRLQRDPPFTGKPLDDKKPYVQGSDDKEESALEMLKKKIADAEIDK